jgi:hypothetical protein
LTIDAPFVVNSAVTAINDNEKIVGVYDTGGAITGGFAGTLGRRFPAQLSESTESRGANHGLHIEFLE